MKTETSVIKSIPPTRCQLPATTTYNEDPTDRDDLFAFYPPTTSPGSSEMRGHFLRAMSPVMALVVISLVINLLIL